MTVYIQWRIQEFQNGGGAVLVCFDAHSHIPYGFEARVGNKQLYNQNLQKQTRKFFQNGGGGARRAGPGSAFDTLGQSVLYYHINDSIHTVLPHE